jgi:hypothetical protein
MALLVVAGALTYMAYALQSPRDRNNLILATALIVVVTLTCGAGAGAWRGGWGTGLSAVPSAGPMKGVLRRQPSRSRRPGAPHPPKP